MGRKRHAAKQFIRTHHPQSFFNSLRSILKNGWSELS